MQPIFNTAIFAQVVLAVRQSCYLPAVEFEPNQHLINDLAIGRIGRWTLMLSLEEVFDIEFPNDVVAHFETLGDIVDYLTMA